MSNQPNVIEDAQQLLDSLYLSGDLSHDQADGFYSLLEHTRGLEKERDEYRHANGLAAQAYVQLESQLGSTRELLHVLQDACRPAATILFNLTQQPGLDPRVVDTIQQTLAPLDAALAATKGGA